MAAVKTAYSANVTTFPYPTLSMHPDHICYMVSATPYPPSFAFSDRFQLFPTFRIYTHLHLIVHECDSQRSIAHDLSFTRYVYICCVVLYRDWLNNSNWCESLLIRHEIYVQNNLFFLYRYSHFISITFLNIMNCLYVIYCTFFTIKLLWEIHQIITQSGYVSVGTIL